MFKRLKRLSPAPALKTVWEEEWTTTWTHIQIVGASLLGLLGSVLNDSSVKAALDSLHLKPEVMLALAIAGVVTLVSQGH